MFSKDERSSFNYWFAHWCAFNMTSLNLKCWRVSYLLHDIEKPWLKLIFKDYKKVQRIHRNHNAHHLEFFRLHGYADWQSMVIDWECSRFTKETCPRNAREEFEVQISKNKDIEKELRYYITPVLDKLNL